MNVSYKHMKRLMRKAYLDKQKKKAKALIDKEIHNNMIDEIITWSVKADPNDVDKWLEYARFYMEDWGWNEKAIIDWLEWGKCGFNNDLLHEKNTVDSFYSEVHYCSDRMSMDRLFRCHVEYQNIERNDIQHDC